MTETNTAVTPGSLILITGVNGFIASHIADNLLKQGYHVRGTVRSKEKANWITEALTSRSPSATLETVIIPDVTALGIWDTAISGVEGIVHAAGDMSFGSDPYKTITPMLQALENLLKAAANEPSVKRFVMTSSNSALLNRTFDMRFSIDRSMWNTIAVENAWRPPPYTAERTWDVYNALKTQTEQQIWDFQRRASPSFTINSVLPCFVAGPLLHPKQSGSTGRLLLDFFNNSNQHQFMQDFGASWFIDVQDAALLHVAALTQEDVCNERLLGFADTFNFNRLLAVFRTLEPEKPWPEDDAAQQHDLSVIDTSREVEILKRFSKDGWTSFYESVRRTCLDSDTG